MYECLSDFQAAASEMLVASRALALLLAAACVCCFITRPAQRRLVSRSLLQLHQRATPGSDGSGLSSVKKRSKEVSQVEDDGYSISRSGSWLHLFSKAVSLPLQQPGTLILVRHGESSWNFNKTFTGWCDVDISDLGKREVEHAARLLLERGYKVDVVYTSRLKRAIRSVWIILKELNKVHLPVFKSWRLNERMYGALEGLSKPQLALELGEQRVIEWRSGLYARPPPMDPSDRFFHGKERKYSDLKASDIPLTESLQDTMERTLPVLETRILLDIKAGKNVLVVAHANSLRGIVKQIEGLTAEQIQCVGIPNGIPLVYKFDKGMRPVVQELAVPPLSGEFLEKKGLLRAALARETELYTRVPGYDVLLDLRNAEPPMNPILKALLRLSKERQLVSLATNNSLGDLNSQQITIPLRTRPKAPEALLSGDGARLSAKKKCSVDYPYLIIIRHGKTEHNKLGLFTGWEDAPLAKEGRQEAANAGKLLKAHGIEPDVVYTSWLSRAIETAWLLLDELDSLWLPIIKTWRLNERMYGALTGLSKDMIRQQHGPQQFRMWRRSYDTRPPPVSSFSHHYPGNDERYINNVKDIRFSLFESLIRTIAHRRLEVHRKFPKSESLKDCMDRTIPYYTGVVLPDSIQKNKTVLIASSENAIRGLLMHLCDIPEQRIAEVEIPTGLPLIYNIEKRCIQVLEDGIDDDPLSRYNFGSSPDLLFRPCDVASNDTICFVSSSGKSYAYNPIIQLSHGEMYLEESADEAAYI